MSPRRPTRIPAPFVISDETATTVRKVPVTLIDEIVAEPLPTAKRYNHRLLLPFLMSIFVATLAIAGVWYSIGGFQSWVSSISISQPTSKVARFSSSSASTSSTNSQSESKSVTSSSSAISSSSSSVSSLAKASSYSVSSSENQIPVVETVTYYQPPAVTVVNTPPAQAYVSLDTTLVASGDESCPRVVSIAGSISVTQTTLVSWSLREDGVVVSSGANTISSGQYYAVSKDLTESAGLHEYSLETTSPNSTSTTVSRYISCYTK
jgi:cytoskeletal protein RodZ